jgi:hypothetical protein
MVGCTALLAILNVVCLVGSVMVPVSIAVSDRSLKDSWTRGSGQSARLFTLVIS